VLEAPCGIHLPRFLKKKKGADPAVHAVRRVLEAHNGMTDEAQIFNLIHTMIQWRKDWKNFGVWVTQNYIARFMLFHKYNCLRADDAAYLFSIEDNNVSETNQWRIKSRLQKEPDPIRGDLITVIETVRMIDDKDARNIVNRRPDQLVTE